MPYAGKYKDSVFFTGATIIYRFSIKFDPTGHPTESGVRKSDQIFTDTLPIV